MKTFRFLTFGLLAFSLYSCSGSEEQNVEQDIATETYTLLLERSNILWVGDFIKAGALDHSHEGELLFNSGTIQTDEGNIVSGEFELNMASIKELNPPFGDEQAMKFEGHLKSGDYFDSEKFPTAKVIISGNKDGKLQGTITIKGVEMAFDAPVEVALDDDFAKVTGTFNLDFSAFKMDGIGGEGEFVSPKINFDIYLDFERKK